MIDNYLFIKNPWRIKKQQPMIQNRFSPWECKLKAHQPKQPTIWQNKTSNWRISFCFRTWSIITRSIIFDARSKMHVFELLQSEWKKCYEIGLKRTQKSIDQHREYFEKILKPFSMKFVLVCYSKCINNNLRRICGTI